MAETIHPFYESHRGAMEAAMRHRLDLAEAMLCERAHLCSIDGDQAGGDERIRNRSHPNAYFGGARDAAPDDIASS